ncbi:hypothetical protein MFLAVUS_006734 [Mucor flavus]|uniref:Thioredoxin domain-containing protein n=1 Tax=Mucor flavus TaxID=439312 RepID=A0ABP9Z2C6_9FUNG
MVRLLPIVVAVATLEYFAQAINLKELDPKAIEAKKEGALFVEYYSPDSSLCNDFEPKWNQLVKSHPDASFGKLNCVKYKDYCSERGIDRVPSVQTKFNGGHWTDYAGDFSLDDVNDFVIKNDHQRNKHGESIELTSSKQIRDIIDSKEPWFVKFYAPWCGHCKHLKPVWAQLAKNLKNKVNIAEVNCEDSKDLCKEFKVTGLPTLSFFVHGANLKYNGERKLEKLEEYAREMAGSPVRTVKDDDKLQDLLKQQDVNFVYIRDPKNDVHEMSFLETVAPGFMETIPFFTTTDKRSALRFNLGAEDLPAAVIVKDGTFEQFKGGIKDLAAWLIKESKPLVTRVLPHNSNQIMKGRQMVVLGITKPDDSDSEWKLREMARIYKNEHGGNNLTFALLDGKLWGSFISRAYGIQSNKLPAIIVLDPQSELYYDHHANKKKFSFESPDDILESIKNLSALTGISTSPSKTMGYLEKFFVYFGNNWIVLTIIIFGAFIVMFYYLTNDDTTLTREQMKELAKKTIEESKGKKAE